MTMFLWEWKSGFSLQEDMMRTLPIWIKLPNLPLHLWGTSSLSKIGSAVGKPLFTDECTDNKLRVSYACILVEIDITQKLKHTITIRDVQGKTIIQVVEYEWMPLQCEICKKVGHKCSTTSVEKKKPAKQWVDRAAAKITKKWVDSNVVAQHQGERAVVNLKQKQPMVAEPEGWQTVGRSSRAKGKEPLTESRLSVITVGQVECQNGFTALGNLNGPQVVNDMVP